VPEAADLDAEPTADVEAQLFGDEVAHRNWKRDRRALSGGDLADGGTDRPLESRCRGHRLLARLELELHHVSLPHDRVKDPAAAAGVEMSQLETRVRGAAQSRDIEVSDQIEPRERDRSRFDLDVLMQNDRARGMLLRASHELVLTKRTWVERNPSIAGTPFVPRRERARTLPLLVESSQTGGSFDAQRFTSS
jgi:hypothetical protein